ncbi:MAG: type III-A CRISPR-associated protein Csm2 [Coriobacteriales bacterium]|jgi:CRISPR-associated protein Csm2|nr:type III-A CRISPR-associated protein Csm2 [Coriobacteriales bacterium]
MTALLKFKDDVLNDETFAEFARVRVIKKNEDNKIVLRFPKLTTTKLRSIYSMIMNLYTAIDNKDDFEKHKPDIQYLKVKMAYEAGREQAVKEFLTDTLLMAALNYVKTYEHFLLYCRYAESLVAYFKFYDGKDN